MKMLTVRNPWAVAIMLGVKPVENRDWPSRYRGPIGIHASSTMSRREFEDAVDSMAHYGFTFPYNYEVTQAFNGRLLCVVDMVDCVTDHPSPWFQGPFGFVLQNVRELNRLEKIRGSLGLWDWQAPADLEVPCR